jgi:hypothetical protein
MRANPKPLRTAALLLATVIVAVLVVYGRSAAQDLSVAGFPGQAELLQRNGRWFVDVEMLARILGGALSLQQDHLVLRLPSSTPAEPRHDEIPQSALSPTFVNAGIETLFSMREWASVLSTVITKGYPIDDSMPEYSGRAAKSLALLHTSATTSGDHAALQLIANEFNNLQGWSNHLIEAKKSMRTGHYSMSPDALANDDQSKRIVRCWQFLGPMLASGHFQDNGSCK